MTTEELRVQLSEIIRSPSEMTRVISLEAIIGFIAAGFVVFAIQSDFLISLGDAKLPSKIQVTTQNSSSQDIIAGNRIFTQKPQTTIFEESEMFTGVCVALLLSVPGFAYIASRQEKSNRLLREKADRSADSIMDVWSNIQNGDGSLRTGIRLITRIEQVEVDEGRIRRILAVLASCGIEPAYGLKRVE